MYLGAGLALAQSAAAACAPTLATVPASWQGGEKGGGGDPQAPRAAPAEGGQAVVRGAAGLGRVEADRTARRAAEERGEVLRPPRGQPPPAAVYWQADLNQSLADSNCHARLR